MKNKIQPYIINFIDFIFLSKMFIYDNEIYCYIDDNTKLYPIPELEHLPHVVFRDMIYYIKNRILYCVKPGSNSIKYDVVDKVENIKVIENQIIAYSTKKICIMNGEIYTEYEKNVVDVLGVYDYCTMIIRKIDGIYINQQKLDIDPTLEYIWCREETIYYIKDDQLWVHNFSGHCQVGCIEQIDEYVIAKHETYHWIIADEIFRVYRDDYVNIEVHGKVLILTYSNGTRDIYTPSGYNKPLLDNSLQFSGKVKSAKKYKYYFFDI